MPHWPLRKCIRMNEQTGRHGFAGQRCAFAMSNVVVPVRVSTARYPGLAFTACAVRLAICKTSVFLVVVLAPSPRVLTAVARINGNHNISIAVAFQLLLGRLFANLLGAAKSITNL